MSFRKNQELERREIEKAHQKDEERLKAELEQETQKRLLTQREAFLEAREELIEEHNKQDAEIVQMMEQHRQEFAAQWSKIKASN